MTPDPGLLISGSQLVLVPPPGIEPGLGDRAEKVAESNGYAMYQSPKEGLYRPPRSSKDPRHQCSAVEVFHLPSGAGLRSVSLDVSSSSYRVRTCAERHSQRALLSCTHFSGGAGSRTQVHTSSDRGATGLAGFSSSSGHYRLVVPGPIQVWIRMLHRPEELQHRDHLFMTRRSTPVTRMDIPPCAVFRPQPRPARTPVRDQTRGERRCRWRLKVATHFRRRDPTACSLSRPSCVETVSPP